MPTLYGIGVGPGDPELLTLKAARILQSVPVIAGPVASLNGESYALTIIADLLRPEQNVIHLHFPMVRDLAERQAKRKAAAQTLVDHLTNGDDVAFVTEGDPLLHSTFGYILEYLPKDIQVEVVPGVSSIMAASADARIPLVQANETLAVIPAAHTDMDTLTEILQSFDTIVLLKVDRLIRTLVHTLDKLDLLDSTVFVERASHHEGRVIRDLRSLPGSHPHYLSLLIVHTGRGSDER